MTIKARERSAPDRFIGVDVTYDLSITVPGEWKDRSSRAERKPRRLLLQAAER